MRTKVEIQELLQAARMQTARTQESIQQGIKIELLLDIRQLLAKLLLPVNPVIVGEEAEEIAKIANDVVVTPGIG